MFYEQKIGQAEAPNPADQRPMKLQIIPAFFEVCLGLELELGISPGRRYGQRELFHSA